MNIHTHQKAISDLLLEGTRISGGKKPAIRRKYVPGCYILARTLGYNLFKLGEAHGQGGLYERIIGQYKICMSLKTEFFLRYLVIAHRKKDGTKHFSQILEKLLLTTIDSPVEDSYSKEYIFEPQIAALEKKMAIVLEAHKHLYSHAIKFTQSGFRLFEDGGFNGPKLNFAELPNLTDPDVGLLLGLSSKPKPKKKPKKIVYHLKKKPKF